MNKEAIFSGLKELGRVVLLAIISFALTEGVVNTILSSFGIFLDPEVRLVVIGFITSALKAIDKWLHEVGKAKEEETGNTSALTSGLTRF